MQAYLEKFVFKAIFAAAVFVGAALLWLLTANPAAAAGSNPLDVSQTVSAVSSTVTSTTHTVATTTSQTTKSVVASVSQTTQKLTSAPQQATQPVTSVLTTTTSTVQHVVKSTVRKAAGTVASDVHHVLKSASDTVSTVTTTVAPVVPLPPSIPVLPTSPVTPAVPSLPLAGQPSTPRDPLVGAAGSTGWLSTTHKHGQRVSASNAADSGAASMAGSTPPQPLPLPTQPGNVPSDGVSGAASQAPARPIRGLGLDIFLLLAIFTLLAGKANYFRYANARKGISLPCQLPSG